MRQPRPRPGRAAVAAHRRHVTIGPDRSGIRVPRAQIPQQPLVADVGCAAILDRSGLQTVAVNTLAEAAASHGGLAVATQVKDHARVMEPYRLVASPGVPRPLAAGC